VNEHQAPSFRPCSFFLDIWSIRSAANKLANPAAITHSNNSTIWHSNPEDTFSNEERQMNNVSME